MRNGTQRRTQRREARADCGRGAACLLAHLPVLNLYVVSATGSGHPPSLPSPPPLGGGPSSRGRRETESPVWHRLYGKGARRNAVGRERLEGRAQGRDISSRQRVLRSRNRVKRVGQTDDRRAGAQHPPHYAHRSRDFNVPLEMAACRAEPRGGGRGTDGVLSTIPKSIERRELLMTRAVLGIERDRATAGRRCAFKVLPPR